MRVSLDFETTSCVDIERGAPRYAEDSSTRVLVASWSLDGRPPRCWIIGDEPPWDLLDLAADPATTFVAWGASFERAIWARAWTRQQPHAPAIPIARWTCSMTRGLVWGLPRSLEQAGLALGAGAQKDLEGRRLMLRMSKPTRKGDWLHEDEPELLIRLAAYCMQDVVSEQAVARRLPPTPPEIEASWRLNQKMNDRGVLIDQELVSRAMTLVEAKKGDLHQRLADITKGQVTSPDQREKLTAWLYGEGCAIPDLRRPTVLQYAADEAVATVAREALQIRADGSRAALGKLRRMREAAMADGRIRDPVLFYAAHTGRMSGAGGGGLQIQNFVRSELPKGVAVDDVIKSILDDDADLDDLEETAEVDGLAAIASALRGCIVAAPGNLLVACDFSGIEARVLAWLAGHADLLRVFARGENVYLKAARDVGSQDAQLGKVIVLSLGYQMGHAKFLVRAKAAKLDMDEARAQEVVYGWRNSNQPIVNLWKTTDAAARWLGGGRRNEEIRIGAHLAMRRRGDMVLMTLPSGRELVYRGLRVVADSESPVGSSVVYDGAKMGRLREIRTFGGSLIENACQAISYDLLDATMKKLDACGAPQSFSVHDEVVCETKAADAPRLLRLMRAAMKVGPAWSKGLPLEAKGWAERRFKKD